MKESRDANGTPGPETVVIVGNGMVSQRLCAELAERGVHRRMRIVVVGEEPLPAYDRVHLTDYFGTRDAASLVMAPAAWYAEHGIELVLGRRVAAIDREIKEVVTEAGGRIPYDYVVLATGSAPFVPRFPGVDKDGVFTYRTIADLERIIAYAGGCRRAAVLGGGLLGLEAAKALHDLGLETHVIEFAPRLMPRQLDDAGAGVLKRKVEALGVTVHTSRGAEAATGNGSVTGLVFGPGETLDADMVVISAGIRPRDELARDCGLAVGDRGGVLVDDALRTNDPAIFAIGEVALHGGVIYGLVGPGYQMAQAVAAQLAGEPAVFSGADMSTKLKLLGVDVASFGNPLAEGPHIDAISYLDNVRGVYKKLVVDIEKATVLGGMLVGDASDYAKLHHLSASGTPVKGALLDLLVGPRGGAAEGGGDLPDEAQVCSCNNVCKGAIRAAIREGGLSTAGQIAACTKAGAGCGGCSPLVSDILAAELKALGKGTKKTVCEHFAHTRQELYALVKIKGYRTFEELLAAHGAGHGCEVCKPVAASIIASVYNEPAVRHSAIQDTNDRYLANIQKGGTYSVIPRVPGGEITPDKLVVLGEVAKAYGLYCKITGGQRIDLLGARVDQLPAIWEALIAAGFESGHAYGKALRTVKSCVGQTWCRYGVQDSTSLAIRVEQRYRGLRAPHKIKSAVSGCTRECAEAQSKDFGLIATENGWNLYVCGNGGTKPRHADLIAADIDEDTAIRYIDRFLMYYIRTADPLTRTSRWLDKLEGGIEHLKDVVIGDSLGLAEEFEREMDGLVAAYTCEWAEVVRDTEKRRLFTHFVNTKRPDPTIAFVPERDQRKPAERPASSAPAPGAASDSSEAWWDAAAVEDIPRDAGACADYHGIQIAIFHLAGRGEWYATQNLCPHKREMVLARGLTGDAGGVPKVACPMHKRQFSLTTGESLNGEDYRIATFPVKIENGRVLVSLPSPEALAGRLCAGAACDRVSAGERELAGAGIAQ